MYLFNSKVKAFSKITLRIIHTSKDWSYNHCKNWVQTGFPLILVMSDNSHWLTSITGVFPSRHTRVEVLVAVSPGHVPLWLAIHTSVTLAEKNEQKYYIILNHIQICVEFWVMEAKNNQTIILTLIFLKHVINKFWLSGRKCIIS